MGMRVRATQLGYYGMEMRPEGSTFEITSEKHFSKKWMEPLNGREARQSEEEEIETKVERSKGKREIEKARS
jgi:hypothetical protein